MKKILIPLAVLFVCQTAKAADVNSVDPNLYLQKIRELEEITKTQQQEISRLTAEIADVKKEIERLRNELAKLKGKNLRPREQIGEPASSGLFTGEETTLTMLASQPEQYVGKTFILVGGIGVVENYIYKYSDAKLTHISLGFYELRQDMSRTGRVMMLYVRREIANNLIETISKAVDAKPAMLIRAKVSILEDRFDPHDPTSFAQQAELLNWQYLSSDKKSWQDWVISEGTE